MIDYGFNSPSFPDGSTFTLATNASTVYQGIGNFSALAVGMIANLDLTLQSDGSLLATRIEVDDPGATNVLTGPPSGRCLARQATSWSWAAQMRSSTRASFREAP